MKSWPIISSTIIDLYELLLPFYETTHRKSLKNRNDKDQNALYPQELMQDINELLRAVQPELSELTVDDVKSRIEYQLNPRKKCANCKKLKSTEELMELNNHYYCKECLHNFKNKTIR